MITQAMWAHGHTMRVENSAHLVSAWRAGSFVRVIGRLNTTNWFHFAMPTPVIVKDKRQMTDSVMLRFRAGSDFASVTNVHVYDGERRIARHDGLDLSPSAFGLSRFDVPGKPDVRWGVGISVGVRFSGNSDARNTLEFSSAGCDFKLLETVRLHVKVLTAPTRFTIDDMVAAMRESYEPAGFRVIRASDENLNLPELNVVDIVNNCPRGETTEEQRILFGNRNNVGANDIVVYFVQATDPIYNGCAAHPDQRPGAVVVSAASRWTLGHEVGHVLGLRHVDDDNRLMTGNGTDNIINPPPDLIASEIRTMRNSSLTINP